MEYSNLLLNAKDIDEKKGIVAFYFADFATPDSNGRMMKNSAFNRTFNANTDKARMRHYKNHDKNIVLGKIIELGKDEKGAFAVSQLSKSDEGRNIMIQYNEGLINEHSFGFEILNSHKDGKVEVVDEVKLWEVSSITGWGAHSNTPMISLNHIEDIKKKIEAIETTVGLNESILNKLDLIIARLPASLHQTPLNEDNDIQSVINFLNNY